MTRTSRFRLSVAASSALFALSLTFLAVHAHAHPLRAAPAPTLDVVVSEVAWMGTPSKRRTTCWQRAIIPGSAPLVKLVVVMTPCSPSLAAHPV